jgi:hypothetical protein
MELRCRLDSDGDDVHLDAGSSSGQGGKYTRMLDVALLDEHVHQRQG